MPWVKFDDQYPRHPKIAPLTDRQYRLHSDGIFWCARHLTDGVIRRHLLDELRLRPRVRPADADDLVAAGLWHSAEDPPCPNDACPHDGTVPDGWVIHDYWDYQPSREAVERERRDRAARQRRWRERRRASNASTAPLRNAPVDASRNAPVDASRNAPVDASPRARGTPPARPGPPRPEGSEGGTPSKHNRPAPAGEGGAGAGRATPRTPAQAAAAAKRAAIARCPLCDEHGYLPTGRTCLHDPTRLEATSSGAQAARAAIRRRPPQEDPK